MGQVPNSDTLSVGGTLTGGGNLVVTLVAGASAPSVGEVFQFFNKGVSGFASISLPDLSAYPGLVWDANNLAVNGSIRVAPAAPPSIGTVSLSGSDFVFSGTGGVEGGNYYVLTSTNVAAPMATWVPVATNVLVRAVRLATPTRLAVKRRCSSACWFRRVRFSKRGAGNGAPFLQGSRRKADGCEGSD